jgi:hypothetical protein
MRQEKDDAEAAQNTRLTTRKVEKMFHERMVAIRDSLSDIASSKDGEDGEEHDDNHQQNVIRSRSHRPTSQTLL